MTQSRTSLEGAVDSILADAPVDPNAGSTDMANVSHVVPTIHPYTVRDPALVDRAWQDLRAAGGGREREHTG